MSSAPIAILGAGNMASALALNLARHKRPIRLYCIEADVEADIRKNHRNSKYLAGQTFPKWISASNDLAAVLKDAEDVFIAIPSQAVLEVMAQAKPFLSKKIKTIASLTKGIDSVTLLPMVLAEKDFLPSNIREKLCMMGGPAIATEMAAGSPTGFVIAGTDLSAIKRVKTLVENQTVKCASSKDLLGVGLASALKNCYAIALGMCDGLKYPTNAKAMIMALAVEEMEQILVKAGASADTAAGLAGLGDLIVTGMSPHGRNRTYGERLVGAKTKDPKTLGLGTVEGIHTTDYATRLAKSLHAPAPLLIAIDQCLRKRDHFDQPFIRFLAHLRLA